MVTIADVLALPAFKDVRLVAPCEGAGRRSVRNVGILDCPPDLNGYSNYFPGELILTNLGFASGNERLSERSLITLIDRHVAGVAIKTVYDPIITDAVREESSREGVPVFVYDETPGLANQPLVGRGNVVITSQSAFFSTASMRDVQVVPCQNIVYLLHGERDQRFKLVDYVEMR